MVESQLATEILWPRKPRKTRTPTPPQELCFPLHTRLVVAIVLLTLNKKFILGFASRMVGRGLICFLSMAAVLLFGSLFFCMLFT